MQLTDDLNAVETNLEEAITELTDLAATNAKNIETIAAQDALIAELQATALTPEQIAILDKIMANSKALADLVPNVTAPIDTAPIDTPVTE